MKTVNSSFFFNFEGIKFYRFWYYYLIQLLLPLSKMLQIFFSFIVLKKREQLKRISVRSNQTYILVGTWKMDKELTAEHIMMTLHQMQHMGDMCDVTLVSADGDWFVAHAGILAAACSLLKQELAECEPGNYNIVTSFSGHEISALIYYAYTGDTTDPLLSSFTHMGLLCDTNVFLSHATAILSLLHDFSHRGVFCNMSFCGNIGDTESGHAYLLAANCPTSSQHITNQSRINLHLALHVPHSCDIKDEFVSIIYCLGSINKDYDSHLYDNVNERKTKDSHPSNKIFHCTKCSKVIKTKRYFIKHQFYHLDHKPTLYKCSSCKRVFSHKQYLMIHNRSHKHMVLKHSITAQQILNALYRMQQSGDLCDVTLVTSDGEQFVAHAGILAAACSLLKQELAECALGNYNIVTSFSGREISVLIQYAYTGDTTDPLLSSFTDMGLLCDTNGLLSHAAAILSLLHDFYQRGVFCNMSVRCNEGDIESGHAYLVAAICPRLLEYITNQSRVNLHLDLPVHVLFNIQHVQREFVSIIYCLRSINKEYGNHLCEDVISINTNCVQPSIRELLICVKCRNAYVTKTPFISDQFRHLDTKPALYTCSTCNRLFSRQQYLMIHEVSHMKRCDAHIEHTIYTCSTCNKEFNQKRNLLRHEKSHIPHSNRIILDFICDTCGKTLKSKQYLNEHIKAHGDERPFVCSICDKRFKQRSTLTKHKLIHEDKRNYICDKCGKGFKTKPSLSRHGLTHTDLKPYACDYCHKRFNQKPNLKTHQLVHTREKSHVCETCGVSYGYKSMLKKHLLSHDKCHT